MAKLLNQVTMKCFQVITWTQPQLQWIWFRALQTSRAKRLFIRPWPPNSPGDIRKHILCLIALCAPSFRYRLAKGLLWSRVFVKLNQLVHRDCVFFTCTHPMWCTLRRLRSDIIRISPPFLRKCKSVVKTPRSGVQLSLSSNFPTERCSEQSGWQDFQEIRLMALFKFLSKQTSPSQVPSKAQFRFCASAKSRKAQAGVQTFTPRMNERMPRTPASSPSCSGSARSQFSVSTFSPPSDFRPFHYDVTIVTCFPGFDRASGPSSRSRETKRRENLWTSKDDQARGIRGDRPSNDVSSFGWPLRVFITPLMFSDNNPKPTGLSYFRRV